MKRVFGDAWFFLALLNPNDSAHARTRDFAVGHSLHIVTTRWILAEVADGLARGPRLRSLAANFLTRCGSHPSLQVLPVNEEQFLAGLSLYHSRLDKEWSLTDCISFVVMEREGLREALTGDRHFEQAGFLGVFAE
jgi:predicted nucleic acid-binding protein